MAESALVHPFPPLADANVPDEQWATLGPLALRLRAMAHTRIARRLLRRAMALERPHAPRTAQCRACLRPFVLLPADLAEARIRGWDVPTHCPPCLRRRRQARARQRATEKGTAR